MIRTRFDRNPFIGSGIWLVGLLAAGVLLLAPGRSEAVKPTAEVMERLRAEGRLEAYQRSLADARQRGLCQPSVHGLAASSAAPVAGTLRTLVILVDFADNPSTSGTNTDTADFVDLLFSTNTPRRSLTDFYTENSYGKVHVEGDVVGWFRMPRLYDYYVNGLRGLGPWPQNSQTLAWDALTAAEAAGVDFSLYDNDNNGQLDGFFVVHAGPGFEETGSDDDIHSHKWNLTSLRFLDGVSISGYTMQPEEQGDNSLITIGVFCHEFGHFFGLPDFYDTDGSSQGIDKWALMAAGNWARSDGSSPAHFCAWSKIQLGWLTPITPSSNITGAVFPQMATDTVVYRLWTGGTGGNEYYLVENRQKTGFDSYLPAGGLLIYHVDDALTGNAPNNNEWYPTHTSSGHYKLALEQADGRFDLETSSGTGPLAADGGDPWPGSTQKFAFDDVSLPDSRAYDGQQTQVAVWNISQPGSTMTANIDVLWSRPNFELQELNFTDDGDSDGTPDPGEQVGLFVTHQNLWQGVGSATLSVSTDDPDLTFSDSVQVLGAVPSGDSSTNTLPITFDVPPGKVPRITDFYVTISADGGSYVKTDTVRVDIGPKQVLLIDDDERLGPPTLSYDSVYILPVLDSMRMPHDRWEIYSGGVPSNLDDYPSVIWYTGTRRLDLFNGPDTIITPTEVAALKSYLDNGGALFMTGQQVVRYLDSMDTPFLNDYLKASYAGPAGDILAWGVDGDAITDSTKYITVGPGGAADQIQRDLISPMGGAVTIFTETNTANITGIRYDGAYRLVLLGWGIEAIGDDVDTTVWKTLPRITLIDRALNWLLARPTAVGDEDVPVIPQAFDLKPNYPNPFNPSTTIEFVIGVRPAHAKLHIYNLLGQTIKTLADGTYGSGRHTFTWDGTDQKGREVGTGVYFYRLETDQGSQVRKMLLLK